MKKLTNYKFILLLVFVAMLFATCTKKKMDVRFDPQIETVDLFGLGSASVTITGYVVAEGDDGFTEKGICYNKTGDPTISDDKTIYTGTGDSATFTVTVTGLDYSTTYYATAYGVNSEGVLYGSDTTFTTHPVVATLTTVNPPTDTTENSFVSGGDITNAGGSEITARGIVYSTDPNPTLDDGNDGFTEDGTGVGAFISTATGLISETLYYYRAYAVNGAGTGYGNEDTVRTEVASFVDRTWYLPGDHQGWTPSTAPTIKNTVASPNMLTGYAWLNTEFKFTPEPNWDNSWGDDGADGILDDNGANIAVTPGYYYVEVNYGTLTYTLTATDWGLIGSGVPPYDWSVDQDMTYSAVTQTWLISETLASGVMKFRANDDWTINYGDNEPDGTLEAGGSDIPVSAGDFTVTMDLSQPNNYTYNVTQWGLIGSSVPPYDWSVDQDMSLIPATNQWTITLDLVIGVCKFRANDDWAINYGDNEPDGVAEAGGTDIPIAADGNYTITIDLSTLAYTIVLN